MEKLDLEKFLIRLRLKYPQVEQVIENVAERIGGIIPQSLIETIIDVTQWSEVTPKQAEQWLKLTYQVFITISQGRSYGPEESLAWIRLYGICHELIPYFKKYEKWNALDGELSKPDIVRHFRSGLLILRHLESIKQSMTKEEYLTLEYLRNCQAHVFQSGYRMDVHLTEDNKVSECRATRSGLKLKELELVISRVLALHDANEQKFLSYLIERTIKPLGSAVEQVDIWKK